MIKYFVIFILVIFFVFNQVFFFDLFQTSIKVILLLILYLMVKNIKRETKQIFLFFIFLCFEILVLDVPGYMTLTILILEQLFEYLGNLFKINFIYLIEYFSYFLVFFYFNEGILTFSFLVNLFTSIVLLLILLVKKYGPAKIFRN